MATPSLQSKCASLESLLDGCAWLAPAVCHSSQRGTLLLACREAAEIVAAAKGTPATERWEVLDSGSVRLTATIETEVQGYGNAVVDPREYPRDSPECTGARKMAAAYGMLPPTSEQAQGAMIQAVNMYEGEGEFAGRQ